MMSDDDLRERYDADAERHRQTRLAWVPASLSGRALVTFDAGRAFWVDAFRGYPGGVTFTTHYRWVVDDSTKADPDEWPELAIQFPSRDPVTITADVDGRDEPRTTGAEGRHALHAIGSAGMPGIATANWWLPEVPQESLALSFSHPSIGLGGSTLVDARGWAAEIAAHALRIG
jgi:hypothetical protein